MLNDTLHNNAIFSGDPALYGAESRPKSQYGNNEIQRTPKLNIRPTYRPAVVPDYGAPRRRAKLAKFNVILNQRLTAARKAGLFVEDPHGLLSALDQAVDLFIKDSRFDALTVIFREDESIQLARVSSDKRNIDYLTLEFDEDLDGIRGSFSRFVNKKSIPHISNALPVIFQQIVGLTEV